MDNNLLTVTNLMIMDKKTLIKLIQEQQTLMSEVTKTDKIMVEKMYKMESELYNLQKSNTSGLMKIDRLTYSLNKGLDRIMDMAKELDKEREKSQLLKILLDKAHGYITFTLNKKGEKLNLKNVNCRVLEYPMKKSC